MEYESPGHPESPERVKNTYEFLKTKGYEFVDYDYCQEEDILLCHTQELIDSIKSNNFFDPDTPNLPGIYDYARLSVGGSLKALDITNKERISFALIRPPGHHASKSKLGGFCYFNNIAITVMKSLKKCAIIDIDCHHGNGTQDIFLGDDKVMYFSIHRNGYFYPGTGTESIRNCMNYPLHYPSESDWLKAFDSIISKVREFSPELIAVSAGFDTYQDDPIAGLGLKEDVYEEIGKEISNLSKPTLCVLEGGYSDKLPVCLFNFLKGLECSV